MACSIWTRTRQKQDQYKGGLLPVVTCKFKILVHVVFRSQEPKILTSRTAVPTKSPFSSSSMWFQYRTCRAAWCQPWPNHHRWHNQLHHWIVTSGDTCLFPTIGGLNRFAGLRLLISARLFNGELVGDFCWFPIAGDFTRFWADCFFWLVSARFATMCLFWFPTAGGFLCFVAEELIKGAPHEPPTSSGTDCEANSIGLFCCRGSHGARFRLNL